MLRAAVPVLVLYYATFSFTVVAEEELLRTSECVCLSQNVTYQCTVCDPMGIFTVWKFPNTDQECDIVLRHANFTLQVPNECDHVAAVGQGLSVKNDCYTSLLTVLVSRPSIIIGCEIDLSNGQRRSIVNGSNLIISSEPLSPPSNISLKNITRESDNGTINMTFKWQPPLHNCPLIGYSISTNSCGICTDIYTTSTSPTISCRDIDLPKNCTVTVESHTCGNFSIQGRSISNPLFINLEAPSSPVFANICAYPLENGSYMLQSTFYEVESIRVSSGISAPATSYTITYSDSISKRTCGEYTIPASTCQSQICTHELDVTSSSYCTPDANISVTVYATNVLGNGGVSAPINQFISCLEEVTHSEGMRNTIATIVSSVVVTLIASIAAVSAVIIWICLKIRDRKRIHTFRIDTASSGAEPLAEDSPRIYNVDRDYKMAEFSAANKMDRSHIKKGYWYYQWEDVENIKSKREVVVYRKAQKVVYLCQRQEYGNERKFHPPDLTDQELDAIFVQSKSENKTLKQNTLVLYRKPPIPPLREVKKFRVYRVDSEKEVNMADFGRRKIWRYDHGSGYGYFQFTKPEFISQNKKVLLRKKTGEVFTGHIHFDTDGEIKPPNFDENSEWKCAFIQSTSSDRMLEPNTEFLYCKLSQQPCSEV